MCTTSLALTRIGPLTTYDSSHFNATLSKLLITVRQLIIQAELREIPDLDPLSTQENSTVRRALKVPSPVHAAIILACRLVQRHSHPSAHTALDLGHFADKRHGATAVVVRGEDAAAQGGLDSSGFDFLERSLDLSLLDFRRVGVEAAEFLRFLPGHDAVGAGLVVFGAHVVLFDGRGVGVVRAGAGGSGVDDLVGRTVVSIVWFWV